MHLRPCFLGLLFGSAFAFAAAPGGNPLVKQIFTADPTGRVFNDRLYVYTSHDESDANYWDMVDWRLLSTADLVTWKDHGPIFSLKGFAWAKKWAWAPDCVQANGRYYLFLPTDRSKIGVAVSDSPEGPFVDAIGKPLLDNTTMPEAGREPIDPAVFIDDDGQAYLFFGCRELKMVRLDRSLTKLASGLQEVVLLDPQGRPIPRAAPDTQPSLPMGYGEAPWMFKRAGKYYFVYSNGWAKESTQVYAIGDAPTGPFTYAGKVMEHVDCVTHHGSIVQFHGKWYVFYHTSELSGGNAFRRSVCIDELTFGPDGRINTVTATKDGPAPSPAASTSAVVPPPKAAHSIASGPFQPTWESLAAGYRAPDWFRDAKFGIWAHWSAQCVPEEGDWYARNMYLQGSKNYAYHVAHYGHPSKFGFMELDNLWKAEKWEPEKLMALYKRAGAKYFVALANHHDNFDAYDSKYQPWNSVNVGPKKDIVGTWAKLARENGLRFGVSNHSSHAWHWFQPAYGHDVEGPLAGVPYDAATLTKADGKGKWWEGLDPQDLYGGLRIPMPNNLPTAAAAEDWHRKIDGNWYEVVPPNDNGYAEKWFLRTQDLVDKYQPDLLYFDDSELPLGQIGLDIAAHLYNASAARNGGRTQAVLNCKDVKPAHRPAVVPDIERGVAEGIRPEPWQTDTCIGNWHYDRHVFEEHRYKSVGQVVRMLVDIVSKNGNLLLSIPVRGTGEIDADEVSFLDGLAKWMDVNGEAIFGTRPWQVYGEGPSVADPAEAGQFGGARDVRSKPYTAEDLRFTAKGGALYAIVLEWPEAGTVLVKSLATTSSHSAGRKVSAVTLLGSAGKLTWSQEEAGLRVQLPAAAPCDHAVTLKIEGIVAP